MVYFNPVYQVRTINFKISSSPEPSDDRLSSFQDDSTLVFAESEGRGFKTWFLSVLNHLNSPNTF